MDNATNHLNDCPRCGIKTNKASGRCPSCGLLFGNKHRAEQQQQKPHKPQPTRPSTTPTPQSVTGHRPPKAKPDPVTKFFGLSNVEENQPVTQTPSITPQPAAEVPATEEEQPVSQARSSASPTTDEVPAPEEEQPAMQDIIATPQPAAEAPAIEEEQPVSQAISIIPPAIPAVPSPKEIQVVMQALSIIPAAALAALAPREIQLVTEVISVTPLKTEMHVPEEKQTNTEPPFVTPPPTRKVPAPESWEPRKYQSIFTTGGWCLPPVNILNKPTEIELNQSDVEKRAQLIEEAINSYGVEAKVVQINVGPTVTQFGVEPGWDRKYKKIRERDEFGNDITRLEEVSKTRVKVDRISALANDLALALAAPSIRIEAPVPGKSVVGIEVPNTTFSLVNLRGVIESSAFQKAHAKSKLALALGKGAGGETVAGYLDRMPHLLIAGATGSGKTACLNSIICCLLIHNTPDDVQCIMIDPKRVELVNFNSLPHLAAPVVVDSDKAILALRWLNQEMDNRYNKFARAGARNIDSYNTNRHYGDTMPYIVVVIDELADLMMAAFDEVEHTLCRLAQLARATGIHMVVATQRPSVDVVTGLIKANFPTRISFALTSQVDSRTILDAAGAEKLLGRGDMLYMPTDASKPKRLQGTFISDAEIERIVSFWGNQKRPEMKPLRFEEMSELASTEKNGEDAMLEAARQLAQEHKNISSSFLQRRLRIGYPRAARIMEKLAEEGYSRGTAESNGQ
jgi:DNA segregation ATPase FtsK/SpoIIIE-like protein